MSIIYLAEPSVINIMTIVTSIILLLIGIAIGLVINKLRYKHIIKKIEERKRREKIKNAK